MHAKTLNGCLPKSKSSLIDPNRFALHTDSCVTGYLLAQRLNLNTSQALSAHTSPMANSEIEKDQKGNVLRKQTHQSKRDSRSNQGIPDGRHVVDGESAKQSIHCSEDKCRNARQSELYKLPPVSISICRHWVRSDRTTCLSGAMRCFWV